MTIVKRKDVAEAYRKAGAVPGDTIVFHGSMKSLGYMEGGPTALFDGILDSCAPGGTAAIATLWYNGKPLERPPEKFVLAESPAYNGLMAESLRKDPRSLRSNNFSHSVSAIGSRKEELTENHGGGKKFPTPWNDEAFAEVSPWSKFYLWNALYTFIGVDFNVCTMKHYIESRLADHFLSLLPPEKRSSFRLKLAHDMGHGVWCPFNMWEMQDFYEEKGLVSRVSLGDAVLLSIRTRPLVDVGLQRLLDNTEKLLDKEFAAWVDEVKNFSR